MLAEAIGLLLGPAVVGIAFPISGYKGIFWTFIMITVTSWATTWATLIAETFDPVTREERYG